MMERSTILVTVFGVLIGLVSREAHSQPHVPLMPPVPPVPPSFPPPPALNPPAPVPPAPPVAAPPSIPSAAPPNPPASAPLAFPPPPLNFFGPNGVPRYEVDRDSYYFDPTKNPTSKGGQKNATEPMMRYRYEYDFIEPDPTTTPRPVYFPKIPVYVPPPQPKYIAPPKTTPNVIPFRYTTPQRPAYQPQYYQSNMINPYKQQILRLKQQQLLRARQVAAAAQTPLYSPYPLRDFVRIAAANGIKCYTLYGVYGIKPRTSYASICNQKATCPYPYVKPVQVGQICICCSNFSTLGSYVTVVRPASTSNQQNGQSSD